MSVTPTFVCVGNFSASTGFAWSFIAQVYADLCRRAAERGMHPVVVYPRVDRVPDVLRDVEVVEGRITPAFLRQRHARTVLLSDRAAWDPRYPLWRAAGVRRIATYIHTAGGGDEPRGVRRALKRARATVPGSHADVVIAVSDFVADRMRDVGMVPADRVHRVWNSIAPPGVDRTEARRALRDALGLDPDRLVVATASRAHAAKGVPHLFRAFDRVASDGGRPHRPALVYFGSGPALEEWHAERDRLRNAADVILAGYRDDAPLLIGGADVAVVPSVCDEAFGMAALEPMSLGVPVIASDVGGLPEVVAHGESGILVPPGDVGALARALLHLLGRPDERARLGCGGIFRAARLFDRRRALDDLARLVLGPDADADPDV